MSMINATKALALTLSLGFAGAAFAQETAQPAAPVAEAPATEAPAKDGPGSVYVKETNDAWETRCIRVEEGQAEPCQIYQLLKDEKGTSVAEMALFPLPAGQKAVAGATVSVPLETLLTENLVLQVDANKARVYPYSWCDQIACVARLGFTAEDLAALKAGAKATLSLVPARAPDQKVILNLSLKGITKGYDSLPVPAQ